MLELADIQSGALHPRPSPYVGCYILIRIDDRRAGRELLKRLIRRLPPPPIRRTPARKRG